MPRAVGIDIHSGPQSPLHGCAGFSPTLLLFSADRGKATWRCFYLVFEDRKMLALDRKCGHVFSLGKKISNLEGN